MQSYQITSALGTMSRSQLRAVARKLNVRVGRNKENTIVNLYNAIVRKEARFTLEFTIREQGISDSTYATPIFRKKLRTHKPDVVTLPVK